MAKMRSVNTKFWTDPFISDLSVKQTLLFIYLLTNPHTNMAGIYEISVRQMSFESKLLPDEIKKALDVFEERGKVYYEKGWIIIANFVKNQSMNPSIVKGIKNDVAQLPEWLRDKINPIEKNGSLQLKVTSNQTSLGTGSDRLREMKLNEANLIEANITQADKPQGFKKNYAKAAQADRELSERERLAKTRQSDTSKKTASIDELFPVMRQS